MVILGMTMAVGTIGPGMHGRANMSGRDQAGSLPRMHGRVVMVARGLSNKLLVGRLERLRMLFHQHCHHHQHHIRWVRKQSS